MSIEQSKKYGIVSQDDRNSLSGLEFVQGLTSNSLPLNTMAETMAYDIVEAKAGSVIVIGVPNERMLNPEGTVHGGFAATLLDTCMGLAIRTMIPKGMASTTLELKISMIRPITAHIGLVRAEGLVLNCGRRVGVSEGRLLDSQGKLLGHGTTTCLIFER